MINYLKSWLSQDETSKKHDELLSHEEIAINNNNTNTLVNLISVSDLLNVKLKPIKNIIPSPARNMPPISKFKLCELNKAQLKEILSIKLKPLIVINKIDLKKIYLPRHPVLRELLKTTPVI